MIALMLFAAMVLIGAVVLILACDATPDVRDERAARKRFGDAVERGMSRGPGRWK